MADIKSTIDLVMERTENMVQSDEEKEAEKARERLAKARGIDLGLVEERIKLEELPRLIDEEADDRAEFQKALLTTIIDNLNLQDDPQHRLAAVEQLSGAAVADVTERIDGIIRAYQRRRDEAAGETSDQVLVDLAAKGIGGSALRAVGGGRPAEDDEALQAEYRNQLDAAKKKLTAKAV
jgi:hypothetical protein